MRALVARLGALAETTGDRLTVVFDGKPLDLGPGVEDVQVLFAADRGPDAADREIIRRLQASEDPAAIRVVTSDSALAEAALAAGAEVVSAGSLRRQLEELEGAEEQ
jgi:predicted RNA-binding protein with PIN domain